MDVEIVTFDADPDHGGFGARVDSIVRIFAQFASVRVVLTDWFGGPRVPGVVYEQIPVRDSILSKIRRLRTYYKTDFPRRARPNPPDLVVMESLDILGMHQYGPGVPLILDEHNVYWDLLQYEIPMSPFFQSWLGQREIVRRLLIPRLLGRAKLYEIKALERARRVFVTSDPDRRRILAEVPDLEGRLFVLPNCIDLARFPSPGDGGGSESVVFIGNYGYTPNREAAKFIARELAPHIPDATFVLVGANPPSHVLGARNVVAAGHLKELHTVLRQAALCVAPLQKGSGTRLKILTYLAAGKAVVATRKACEGLEVEDGVHLLIRDNPSEFRLAVQDILRDSHLRTALGRRGRALVETVYDWRVHVHRVEDLARGVLRERVPSGPTDGPPFRGA